MRQAFLSAAIAGAIFITQTQIVIADDYLNGVTAFEQGDHALAVSFWFPLAEQGNAKAQYSLGKLYEAPEVGEEPKYAEAIKWYQQASDQGIAAAQNNLGRLYAQGKGGAVDQARAVEYWQLAAQAKHAMAQYNLGLALFRGEGTEQNVEQAVFWFHQSANNKVSGAQYALGEVYRLGLSVPVDLVEAQKWYQVASSNGNSRAQKKLQDVAKLIEERTVETATLPEDVKVEEPTPQQESNVAVVEEKTPISTASEEVAAATKAELESIEAATQQTEGKLVQKPVPRPAKVITVAAVQVDSSLRPLKNPRRYAGVGSLLITKPVPNPRRK